MHIPELPTTDRDFTWPTTQEIHDVQQAAAHERPPNLHLDNDLYCTQENSIWIPASATDLQLRLCITAHTGPAGHRGMDATYRTLRDAYYWDTLQDDVRTFVRACIHCLSTVGGGKVQRPLGPAIHGTEAKDLLQFDYIKIGESNAVDKYVLMLRDDLSDYKWLFAFPDTAAENVATAIIDWCAVLEFRKDCCRMDRPTSRTKPLGL